MASPTQFRQYHISQNAEGQHIELVRSDEQVAVLAYDGVRHLFVMCRVLLKALSQPDDFTQRVERVQKGSLPKAAKLFETGEDEGNTFYITSLVDGETLKQYLDRQKEMPFGLALQVLIESLEAAHALILVGDLMTKEPLEALRVLPRGATQLEVKVADFHLDAGPTVKTPKASALKAEFKNRAVEVQEWFSQLQKEANGKPVLNVSAATLRDRLTPLLQACVPGVELPLEEWAGKWRALQKTAHDWQELEGVLKPQALLSAHVPTAQQVAQCAALQVKVQSQRPNVEQPYALHGSLLKSGQPVMIEPLPGIALTGPSAPEALDEVRNLPKTGKFPNLVPVVMVEEHRGVSCVAETAVNGVSLKELLEVRGKLDVQEAYLVLAGVDVSLTQLEKAKLGVRRLRVEDVFLFTGQARETEGRVELLTQKLGDWPGFSVVLRVHNSLHAMGGRGEDPGSLLPLNHGGAAGVEPVWHGGWMAALGCFITGMVMGTPGRRETGVAEIDTVSRLLDDELERSARGEASGRAAFLSRFARVMQQFHLAQFTQAGGFWAELSGSISAQDRAAEVSQSVTRPASAATAAVGTKKAGLLRKIGATAAAAPVIAPPPEADEGEGGGIGFAEMLIGQTYGEDTRSRSGTPFGLGDDDDDAGEVESSWVNMREERSFLAKLLLLLLGSMILGAVFAHWSGRAIWQPAETERPEVKAVPVEEVAPEPILDLPGPKPAVPPPASRMPTLAPPATSSVPGMDPASVSAPAAGVAPAMTPVPVPAVAVAVDDETELDGTLRDARLRGVKPDRSLLARAERGAQIGSGEAMLTLGRAAIYGDNGRVDEKKGVEWLQAAVNAGSVDAMLLLANCYLQGRGVAENGVQGVQLLQAASSKGSAEAKDQLGVCYVQGRGVAIDNAKAFQYFLEAYQAGAVSSKNNLGAMYLRGQGVAPDAEKAVLLFTEGAQVGHAESMLALAQCLEYGNGTRANLEQATQWYRQAARGGNASAIAWCREKRVAY